MGPKAKSAQPQALPHGKKDGPRRTPKHVADPAAYKDIYFVEDIIAEWMAKKAQRMARVMERVKPWGWYMERV